MPGCKAVVSTGIRRKYKNKSGKDDPFSLNLALAKSHIAEKSLHGPCLYFDIDTMRLLCANTIGRHLVSWAIQRLNGATIYKELKLIDDDKNAESTEVDPPCFVNIFKKNYQYVKINPNPIGYSQVFDYKKHKMGNGRLPRMIENAFDKMGDDKIEKCPLIFKCYNSIDSSLAEWFSESD